MGEVEDLGKVVDGARLAGALPYIETELQGMEEALISKVLIEVGKNALTPELAYAAWLELASYRALARRLRTKVKIGVSAGERQSQVLNARS